MTPARSIQVPEERSAADRRPILLGRLAILFAAGLAGVLCGEALLRGPLRARPCGVTVTVVPEPEAGSRTAWRWAQRTSATPAAPENDAPGPLPQGNDEPSPSSVARGPSLAAWVPRLQPHRVFVGGAGTPRLPMAEIITYRASYMPRPDDWDAALKARMDRSHLEHLSRLNEQLQRAAVRGPPAWGDAQFSIACTLDRKPTLSIPGRDFLPPASVEGSLSWYDHVHENALSPSSRVRAVEVLTHFEVARKQMLSRIFDRVVEISTTGVPRAELCAAAVIRGELLLYDRRTSHALDRFLLWLDEEDERISREADALVGARVRPLAEQAK